MMLDMITYLYASDDLMRWRAIEAAGPAARSIAAENLDIQGEFVRKQYRLMSDESGATAWYTTVAPLNMNSLPGSWSDGFVISICNTTDGEMISGSMEEFLKTGNDQDQYDSVSSGVGEALKVQVGGAGDRPG